MVVRKGWLTNGNFPAKPAQLIYTCIAFIVGMIFISDILLPLGIAVWIFYTLAVTLSLFTAQMIAPFVIAGFSTALMIGGFWGSPAGAAEIVALTNRTLGVITMWIIAFAGFCFISRRSEVQRRERLSTAQAELFARIIANQTTAGISSGLREFFQTSFGARSMTVYLARDGILRRAAPSMSPEDADAFRTAPAEDLSDEADNSNHLFFWYRRLRRNMGTKHPARRRFLISAPFGDEPESIVIEFDFESRSPEALNELMERASPMIATAFRAAHYLEKMQSLLEENRKQTIELHAANSKLQRQRDELARTRDLLRQRARVLDTSNRYKSQFLSDLAHELRAPLNALIILAQLLADNESRNLTPEQVEFANTIRSSGEDFLALINEILDVSKVAAAQSQLKPQAVTLANLIKKVTAPFLVIAKTKAVIFRTEISVDAPTILVTDPMRLEQILRNLLSNAIKFTHEGEVVLRVDPRGAKEVSFAVSDSGIGISAEHQVAIFERFRQADESIAHKFGGIGLGLSISRELAIMLGGTIELKSKPGKGSTFTLILPYERELAPRKELAKAS